MSLDAQKALVREFHEALWNGRSTTAADEYLTNDCVIQWSFDGHAGTKQRDLEVLSMFLHAFPDFRVAFLDEIVDGDEVVQGWTLQGTHGGDYLGIPASGRQVALRGCNLCRLAGDRIAKITRFVDVNSFRRQLGAPQA